MNPDECTMLEDDFLLNPLNDEEDSDDTGEDVEEEEMDDNCPGDKESNNCQSDGGENREYKESDDIPIMRQRGIRPGAAAPKSANSDSHQETERQTGSGEITDGDVCSSVVEVDQIPTATESTGSAGESLHEESGHHVTGDQMQEMYLQGQGVTTTELRSADTMTFYNLTGNTGVKIIQKQADGGRHSTLMKIMDQSKLRLQDVNRRLFVKTKTISQCELHLQHQGMVTITGRSGEGKTTSSLYLMKSISDKECRTPLIFTDPPQWDYIPAQQASKHPEKYIVLVDDFLGRSNLVPDLQTRWEQKLPMMMPLVECGMVVLILTFRTNIYFMCRDQLKEYSLFQHCPVVEFSTSGSYDEVERQAILDNHISVYARQLRLSALDRMEIIHSKQLLGFPQCCYLFVTNKDMQSKGSKFFTNPLLYLSQCLETLAKRDSISYLVLLLVLFYDGTLPMKVLDQFERSKKDKEILEDLLQIRVSYDIQKPTLGDIESKAQSLRGSYLAFSSGQETFSFLHQSIRDTLFLQFCKGHLSKGIQMCSVQTLLEYVRTVGAVDEDDWVVLVPQNNFGILAKRLKMEIISGNCSLILSHVAFSDANFIYYLFNSFLDNETKMLLVSQKTEKHKVSMSLHFSDRTLSELKEHHLNLTKYHIVLDSRKITAFECDSMLTMSILKSAEMMTLRLLQTAKTTLGADDYFKLISDILACSFYVEDLSLISRMMEEGAQLTMNCFLAACFSTHENKTIFDLSLGSIDICNLSLEVLPDVLLFCIENQRVHHIIKIAECLSHTTHYRDLLQKVCVHVLVMCHNATPSRFISCTKQKKESEENNSVGIGNIIAALHNFGCDCSTNECVLLASGCQDTSAIMVVLNCGGNVMCRSDGQQTPLHLAALYGSVDTMSFLIHHGNTEAVDTNLFTPLHFAVQSLVHSSEKTEILLNEKCNISSKSKTGSTALTLATEAGNIGSLELLLKSSQSEDGSQFPVHAAMIEIIRVVGKSGTYGCKEIPSDPLTLHRLKIIDLLLQYGYSLDERDNAGIAPMELIVKTGNTALLQHFLNLMTCTDILPCLLHHSILHSKVAMFKYLLEKCTDVVNKEGNFPIHTAAVTFSRNISLVKKNYSEGETCDGQILEFLLDQGADVNVVNNVGNTPLHLVSVFDCVNVVSLLIKEGTNIDAQNSSSSTPLQFASRDGNFRVVEFLVQKGASVTFQNENGDTALHLASRHGHLKVVKFLTDNGVDINMTNTSGESPVMNAATHGHLHVVDYLISKGAHVDKLTSMDVIPLVTAVEEDHTKTERKFAAINKNVLLLKAVKVNALALVKFLIHNSKKEALLHVAAKQGHYEIARFLVESGANVKDTNRNGRTPLHEASQYYNVEIVHLLVETGADVNAKDKSGRLPLHYAAMANAHAVMEYLLGAGADVNAADVHLRTSLHYSAENGSSEVVKCLLTHGANLHAADSAHRLPMHYAAKTSNINIMKFFIQQGVLVNSTDNNLQTSLHVAAKSGHAHIVRYLLQNRADVNAVDRNGQTPLHSAAKNGQIKAVQYLFEEGADIQARDRDKRQPLHVAAKNSHVKIVQFLVRKGGKMHATDKSLRTPLDIASLSRNHDMVRYIREEHTTTQYPGSVRQRYDRVVNQLGTLAQNFNVVITQRERHLRRQLLGSAMRYYSGNLVSHFLSMLIRLVPTNAIWLRRSVIIFVREVEYAQTQLLFVILVAALTCYTGLPSLLSFVIMYILFIIYDL